MPSGSPRLTREQVSVRYRDGRKGDGGWGEEGSQKSPWHLLYLLRPPPQKNKTKQNRETGWEKWLFCFTISVTGALKYCLSTGGAHVQSFTHFSWSCYISCTSAIKVGVNIALKTVKLTVGHSHQSPYMVSAFTGTISLCGWIYSWHRQWIGVTLIHKASRVIYHFHNSWQTIKNTLQVCDYSAALAKLVIVTVGMSVWASDEYLQ